MNNKNQLFYNFHISSFNSLEIVNKINHLFSLGNAEIGLN